ncbi:MAG TPA: hypothetical protein VN706_06160 [Gemmatimonadaceae bacterium]|nr:hypothetical protein [Gemmatimonadaceae bacterium]
MTQHTEPNRTSPTPGASRRARRLPATGMPVKGDERRASSIVSLLIHILLILLIAYPVAGHAGKNLKDMLQGAGGPGPAGGGGGGHRGTGGEQEKVQYVAVAPAPTPAPVATPVIPPPQPVIPPPQPKPLVTPPIAQPIAAPPTPMVTVADAKPPQASAPTAGTGGGTGNDGTNGSGPGSGGGVGSGIGPGRGSGVGPGTGGGVQANYPPSTTELFLPPLPYPSKVRGFHMIAEFDVDSAGNVLHWEFTHTPDGGYNKRLEEVLKNTKFRPGTTPDGKPIRMKAQIVYDF